LIIDNGQGLRGGTDFADLLVALEASAGFEGLIEGERERSSA
jgi:hypothetical protein